MGFDLERHWRGTPVSKNVTWRPLHSNGLSLYAQFGFFDHVRPIGTFRFLTVNLPNISLLVFPRVEPDPLEPRPVTQLPWLTQYCRHHKL